MNSAIWKAFSKWHGRALSEIANIATVDRKQILSSSCSFECSCFTMETRSAVEQRVSASYLQQIADLDLAVEWKKVDVPVLVRWGTSDPTTTADESQYLVQMINSFHPGRATYSEFAGMGHGLDLSPSPRAWLEAIQKHQHGQFDSEFLQRVSAWMSSVPDARH